MEPRAKAEQLVNQFKGITGLYESSIQSAIVAADEILALLNRLGLTGIMTMYWQQVKKELENYDR